MVYNYEKIAKSLKTPKRDTEHLSLDITSPSKMEERRKPLFGLTG